MKGGIVEALLRPGDRAICVDPGIVFSLMVGYTARVPCIVRVHHTDGDLYVAEFMEMFRDTMRRINGCGALHISSQRNVMPGFAEVYDRFNTLLKPVTLVHHRQTTEAH